MITDEQEALILRLHNAEKWRQQRRAVAHGLPAAFDDRALEVVVQDHPWSAMPGAKSPLVATEEFLEPGTQAKPQKVCRNHDITMTKAIKGRLPRQGST